MRGRKFKLQTGTFQSSVNPVSHRTVCNQIGRIQKIYGLNSHSATVEMILDPQTDNAVWGVHTQLSTFGITVMVSVSCLNAAH